MVELGEQGLKIAACEGPAEGICGGFVALLEAEQMILERGEVRDVVWGKELALDAAEVGFDLVEPAGLDRGVNEDDVGPLGLEPGDRRRAAMRGAGVNDPEEAVSGMVGLPAHELGDAALEGRDLLLAPAEHLGAMDAAR